MRPQARQFAVGHHADHEEARPEGRDLTPHGGMQQSRGGKGREAGKGHQQQRQEDAPVVPTVTVEAEDEAQQVEGQG